MKKDNQFDAPLFVGDRRRDNAVSEMEKVAEVAKDLGKIIEKKMRVLRNSNYLSRRGLAPTQSH